MGLVRLRLGDNDRPDEPAKEYDVELTEAEEAEVRRLAEGSAGLSLAFDLRAFDARRADGVFLAVSDAAMSMGVPVLEVLEPPRRVVPGAIVSRSALAELERRARDGDADAKVALAAFAFLALPDGLYGTVRELAEAVKV